jgi:hypothetical protein
MRRDEEYSGLPRNGFSITARPLGNEGRVWVDKSYIDTIPGGKGGMGSVKVKFHTMSSSFLIIAKRAGETTSPAFCFSHSCSPPAR